MKDIKLYTTSFCGFCVSAKRLLDKLGLPYQEINLDNQAELRQKLSEENGGYRTVPMIFIDGQFVGGYQELVRLHQAGKLV